MTPCFFEDPSQLPGAGGAWLRGDGPQPPDALWIPESVTPAQARRPVAAGVVGALGLSTVAGVLPSPLHAAAIGGAALLGLWLLSLAVRRLVQGRASRSGNSGLLLYPDHLLYRSGSTCAVLSRTEITGLELRIRSTHGARAAFILRGRTGRGALPAPSPGSHVHLQLDQWLKAPGSQSPPPSEDSRLGRRSTATSPPTDRVTEPAAAAE